MNDAMILALSCLAGVIGYLAIVAAGLLVVRRRKSGPRAVNYPPKIEWPR